MLEKILKITPRTRSMQLTSLIVLTERESLSFRKSKEE